jgi:hypothetical protein
MPAPSPLQARLPLDSPSPAEAWIERLSAALDDPNRHSGFLEQAEMAVEACPGDGAILTLAAISALLDRRPERALVFHKRLSKRYKARPTDHLLQVLALHQSNKTLTARALLERHNLSAWDAFQIFPPGQARFGWLLEEVEAILGRKDPEIRRPSAAVLKRRREASRQLYSAGRTRRTAPAPAPDHVAAPLPPLPQISVELPFRVELDLTPLIAARSRAPEADGRWWRLRERFAHLGLAQGFDELLSLPQLVGVEPLWHQIETVRKVLKQFHGRVLLADEVGLGKTIEAGIALKEYMLRGMVERVLVLAPAALVGQWHEELETKFGVACATTQDTLLRDDADAFWRQNRIIASISTARRQEHAQRLHGLDFDLVVVDEAHHLRDRSSHSWKLVDALNKRFLLLLSATPVQNDLIELYNLLTLLKPGIFKTQKEFRTAYMIPGHPRRPANPERLRELMRSAMIRNPCRRRVEAAAPSRPHDQARRHAGGDGGLQRSRLCGAPVRA